MAAVYLRHFEALLGGGGGLDLPPHPPIYLMLMKEWMESNDISRHQRPPACREERQHVKRPYAQSRRGGRGRRRQRFRRQVCRGMGGRDLSSLRRRPDLERNLSRPCEASNGGRLSAEAARLRSRSRSEEGDFQPSKRWPALKVRVVPARLE